MIAEIKIPSPGESISEVEIGKWLVEDGAYVKKDQEIAEVESDKATLSLISTVSGVVKILIKEGVRVEVGSVACTVDSEQESLATNLLTSPVSEVSKEADPKPIEKITTPTSVPESTIKMTPTAKAIMDQEALSWEDVLTGIRRLTRKDMEQVVQVLKIPEEQIGKVSRSEVREAMSPLRRKLSQRLVAVKNETAMLTTFNEVDMSSLMELRNRFQKQFTDKYGFKLGFNSFFIKAVSLALFQHPTINSMIDGEEIVVPEYHDVAIAVQSPKGLMVPVIRNVETKSVSQIEGAIKELAEKARDKRLTVQEMSGGTFTLTNGGIFGSLMSTPILNPPQSAILGLHSIKDRPVAINGKVEIRPMMYVALSYDHRLIDGKDSVGFLVKIKEMIENPVKLLFKGKEAEEVLLDL